MQNIYREYENQKTNTAKFVKDLDRLEMCLQSEVYQEQQDISLKQEFCGGCVGKFHFDEVEAVFLDLFPVKS